jgi:hypothetical protein
VRQSGSDRGILFLIVCLLTAGNKKTPNQTHAAPGQEPSASSAVQTGHAVSAVSFTVGGKLLYATILARSPRLVKARCNKQLGRALRLPQLTALWRHLSWGRVVAWLGKADPEADHSQKEQEEHLVRLLTPYSKHRTRAGRLDRFVESRSPVPKAKNHWSDSPCLSRPRPHRWLASKGIEISRSRSRTARSNRVRLTTGMRYFM